MGRLIHQPPLAVSLDPLWTNFFWKFAGEARTGPPGGAFRLRRSDACNSDRKESL